MLNIASVNMPKIKPETNVLIIKTLKSKSPAEVADIFNVSKRQVERIRKHYQETGDVHDRPRSGRPRKTTVDSLLVWLSKARPMSTTSQFQDEWTPATPVLSKNCMSDSCSQWSPRSYCCPETSAKQETAKKLTEGWTAEKLHPKRCKYGQQPSGAHLGPRFTQKILDLEVKRLWFGVTSNMDVMVGTGFIYYY